MSLLIVILLISLATVASYAILRGQSTAVHIQSNAELRAAARQAAMTGLTYGVWTMSQSTWSGVGVNVVRSVGPCDKFTISFTGGDPSLGEDDEDYQDYPYRVTVRSTGRAVDPGDATRAAEFTVHAVVRLIPRALSAWPTDWVKMEGYTVYQTKKETTELDIPCRLDGKARFQGRLKVGVHYLSTTTVSTVWQAYLNHLYTMNRYGGYPDYRPLTGRVYLPLSEQDFLYLYYLSSALGFAYSNANVDQAAADWVNPTALTTYQIYPGGPSYTIPTVGSELTNVTLERDPLTNPSGVFYCDGDCKLENSVTVRGTLICAHNVTLQGTSQFLPVDMPALYDTERFVRLPALTANDLTVKPGSITTIQGLVAVFNNLLVEKGPALDPFSVVGRLVFKKMTIKEREPFDGADWSSYYTQFQASGAPYFPIWMGALGFDPQPRITMRHNGSTVQYHWNNWSNPIYTPHTDDDGGLRWEMVRCGEGAG